MATNNNYRDQIILILLAVASLVVIFFLMSCKKDSDGFRIYTVKKGNISCNRLPWVWVNKHQVGFRFKVNDTYVMGDTGGWNKLAGIGEGDHRKNSCRLVCQDRVFGMYVWADGDREMFAIDTLDNGTYYCHISHSYGFWHLTLNGRTWQAVAGKKVDVGYRLYPNLRNPIDHDWEVPIKWD